MQHWLLLYLHDINNLMHGQTHIHTHIVLTSFDKQHRFFVVIVVVDSVEIYVPQLETKLVYKLYRLFEYGKYANMLAKKKTIKNTKSMEMTLGYLTHVFGFVNDLNGDKSFILCPTVDFSDISVCSIIFNGFSHHLVYWLLNCHARCSCHFDNNHLAPTINYLSALVDLIFWVSVCVCVCESGYFVYVRLYGKTEKPHPMKCVQTLNRTRFTNQLNDANNYYCLLLFKTLRQISVVASLL